MPSTSTAGVALRRLARLTLLLTAGCASEALPPSIWPPPNFSLVVEELRFEERSAHVTRRVRVDADGLVVYGTSSRHLVDEATGTSLPVFDRLSVYRLEPDCVRSLARRIDRLGVAELQVGADEDGGTGGGVVLTWQAFDARRVLPGQGRLRGAFAEILAVVSAHLPPGESFPSALQRPIVPVVRGVPEPREDAWGALAAYRTLLQTEALEPSPTVLLDGFALACALGEREEAESWLSRWSDSTADDRRAAPAFPDGSSRLSPELLAGFLPPG